MKNKLIILTALFLASFTILSSCSKDDDDGDDNSLFGKMTATVDGASWASTLRASNLNKSTSTISIIGYPATAQELLELTNPSIDLLKSKGNVILLTIRGIEAKEYKVTTGISDASEDAQGDCMIVYKKTSDASSGGNSYYVAYEATITITEIDTDKKQISGTFTGKLVNGLLSNNGVLEVTNGVFEDLTYIEN